MSPHEIQDKNTKLLSVLYDEYCMHFFHRHMLFSFLSIVLIGVKLSIGYKINNHTYADFRIYLIDSSKLTVVNIVSAIRKKHYQTELMDIELTSCINQNCHLPSDNSNAQIIAVDIDDNDSIFESIADSRYVLFKFLIEI